MPNRYERISMESRGCSSEILKDMYYSQRLTHREIKDTFGIKDDKVLNRWFLEAGISKREGGAIYSFNKHYFDEIDTEEKAYWLGFVWCDGYLCRRTRNGNESYEFKLSLADADKEHLAKLNESLASNYPIKRYKCPNGFKINNEHSYENRLYICNKYFAKNLYDKYGMIANRNDANRVFSALPHELKRHFIRGVIDADGSIVLYYANDKSVKKWKSYKNALEFYTYESLLENIQDYLLKEGLIERKSKYIKRHEGRDGYCTGLKYTGTIQVPRLLNHFYSDAIVYLDRKYQKYLCAMNPNDERVMKDSILDEKRA